MHWEWRRAAGALNEANFDIVAFIEDILIKRFTPKGVLKVEFFEAGPDEDLAYVTYQPLVLHVDSEIWTYGKLGDPNARHVIAHEIGHIILHDHYARAFSNDPSLNIKAAQKEESAEWQTNTFAGYFLLPNHLVRSFHCVTQLLITHCSVPEQLATERSTSVQNISQKKKAYAGEACGNCGNFTLRHVNLQLKCDTCGAKREFFK